MGIGNSQWISAEWWVGARQTVAVIWRTREELQLHYSGALALLMDMFTSINLY